MPGASETSGPVGLAPTSHPGLRLFALSFSALFLELMVIRWVPAVVAMVAYYANLMLISSFLGLGMGAMLAQARVRLLGWFPLALALDVAFLLACQQVSLGGTPDEKRFFTEHFQSVNHLALVGVFVFNTAVFVPLGQEIGSLFHALPNLRAYRFDLFGSLAGTVAFGVFSLSWFSPVLGFGAVAALYLAVARGRARLLGAPVLAGIVFVVFTSSDPAATWSPYHYITVGNATGGGPAGEPPEDLRTRPDPPIFMVRVNQHYYQTHGTLDPQRYSGDARLRDYAKKFREMYLLPYALTDSRERVLVLGAGGGIDAEVALLNRAEHVDAVEIDPVLLSLSRRFNASGVYDDPRVELHLDDARAHLHNAEPGSYDIVAFGYLDSQALFSSMSNVRLDGFVYTVESFRAAFDLVREGGVLSVSFVAGQEWLAEKLSAMLEEATGAPPLVYRRGGHFVLCAVRPGPAANPSPPTRIHGFERVLFDAADAPRVASDDWPYLYLQRATIPDDYVAVIGTLLAISILAVAVLRRGSFGATDAHFLFLGMGFLLLQTKSIGDCSLYFGSTWLVTTLVVAGVLLMALLANEVALRIERFSPLFYIPIFLALLLLLLVDRQAILGLPLAGRAAWVLLAVPLPLFFAGLVFSSTFRTGANPSALFGANLIGAMLGGFSEYLGMLTGARGLSLLVIGAYAASFLFQRAAGRR